MIALSLLLASLWVQDLPTGSDVVTNYVNAKGGAALIRNTTSYRFLFEIRLDGKKTADSEMLQAGDCHLTLHTLPDGSKLSHGTDGKTAWITNKEGVAYPLKGTLLADYLRHNTTVHEALEWPKQFAEIRCIGMQKIDGKEAYEVHFTPADGRTVIRFFGVESGLFVREVQQIDDQGTRSVSEISDYRRVEGLLVPHRRTIRVGSQITEYIVKLAENNITFPADRFSAPNVTQ